MGNQIKQMSLMATSAIQAQKVSSADRGFNIAGVKANNANGDSVCVLFNIFFIGFDSGGMNTKEVCIEGKINALSRTKGGLNNLQLKIGKIKTNFNDIHITKVKDYCRLYFLI